LMHLYRTYHWRLMISFIDKNPKSIFLFQYISFIQKKNKMLENRNILQEHSNAICYNETYLFITGCNFIRSAAFLFHNTRAYLFLT
jgi:hypothetical protein